MTSCDRQQSASARVRWRFILDIGRSELLHCRPGNSACKPAFGAWEPLYNRRAKEYIFVILTRGAARSIPLLGALKHKWGIHHVKKIIVAVNGLLLLSGLLIFTSFLTPGTASASVMPQNSNSSMTMSGSMHHGKRHHRKHRRHHRRHHRIGNMNTR